MNNPNIYINELMSINDATIYDEEGEYDDWFEIYNDEAQPILLDGFYTTDKRDNLTKWQFPISNTQIEPGGYKVIWCDEDQEQGITHTNFKLSGSGEFLALVAPDGITIIDSISFPEQEPDVSYGRSEDGIGDWVFLDSPSPGATNQLLDVESINYIPNSFKITSAYPNPFNASATINFEAMRKGDVFIRIYNITGQLLIDRLYRVKSIGQNKWTWDGTSYDGELFASGIFILQLAAGVSSSPIKIVRAK